MDDRAGINFRIALEDSVAESLPRDVKRIFDYRAKQIPTMFDIWNTSTPRLGVQRPGWQDSRQDRRIVCGLACQAFPRTHAEDAAAGA